MSVRALTLLLLISATAIAVAESEPHFAPGVVSAVPNKSQKTPDNMIRNKSDCVAKRGQWHEGQGYKYCVVPYADGGKLCKNSKDCIGHCLWTLDGKNLEGEPLKKGYGICQSDDSTDDCGRPQFEDGKITYFKCD